ncbi:MAG: AAA family ATPase [Ignavibacteriales bacterium]|nr:AAA family ATPase [Ignavibacteriales bacterium]
MKSNIPNDLKSKEILARGVKSSDILKGNSNQMNPGSGNYFLNPSKFEILSVKMFNLEESLQSQKRTYLLQFDQTRTSYIAAEITIKNPVLNINRSVLNGLTIWYLEDEEVGRNNFNLELKKDWELVEFVQSWGTPLPGFWKQGEGRVEVLLDNNLILKQVFQIGDAEIIDFTNEVSIGCENSNKLITQQPKKIEHLNQTLTGNVSLPSLFEEFDNYIGLKSVKQSLKDFITYLDFVNERKKQGVETDESISANCIFLGNPGTGKTSIARLLGKFFKSIGILENGHVVEVDRSQLIGEYIGETAQKTDKVINQALGGILFIDEAYSLKRDYSSQDFGQEAIDIILKRMEDYNNKFFVIAAGYPDLMQNFLESNPGLKSRFTHYFTFEDYSVNELTEIFKIFANKEKYSISEETELSLTEKLKNINGQNDKAFGNARFVRNLFNQSKIELSKRYQLLDEGEKDFYTLNTLTQDDIQTAIAILGNRTDKDTLEKRVDKYLNEINQLVGLDDVKITFNKIIASLKVDRLKKERSIASIHKNLNSFFIAEQGSGTTTVARLFAKSLRELERLSKGQLVEIDGSTFYGLNKIDAYLMIDELFKKLLGNVILVNDVSAALQCTNDFSDSLLQYFLKKLYLISDDVVAIFSGNKEEIETLINNFPVLGNQFPNVFNFEPYTTRHLLEIALNICQKNNYQLDEGAWQQMLELIVELKKETRKNFYNSRTIKEIIFKAISFQENRILSTTDINESDLMMITFDDLTELRSSGI